MLSISWLVMFFITGIDNCKGWWLVAGGWWLVVGGWWLVVGGWWLVAGGWWLMADGGYIIEVVYVGVINVTV
ncbi:hypothetical protein BSK59_31835 [Paenibacillus odorifer]|uniref:hypothetical protein n=1 Tax=Paenibacillus odorifer TaxID=189426 RepID=UPI00097B6C97|nr:hypothetical protein [Paenibacillus odorifer]OME45582.1 hypothetical protein BSK59_31835 [Paenibacillus odorifer]